MNRNARARRIASRVGASRAQARAEAARPIAFRPRSATVTVFFFADQKRAERPHGERVPSTAELLAALERLATDHGGRLVAETLYDGEISQEWRFETIDAGTRFRSRLPSGVTSL